MAKVKQITAKEAAALVKSDMTVMIGGFMTNGTPLTITEEIAKRDDVKDLTVVCNDAGFQGVGTGALLAKGQIKKLIATHVGLNKECGQKYSAGELDLVLQPQGTLAEQIRAAGAGLGGILTPTGIGTTVAEGKQVVNVDGQDYLLEKPVHGDIAFIQGFVADESGNIRYKGSTRNFGYLMASAADTVVVEVEKIVPAGEIGPEYVETPYVFVDYIVLKEEA